jgi:uncharacterized YigZ family protein
MPRDSSFQVPSKTITVEQDIKRSRFISTAGRAGNKESAKEFINSVSEKYSDATHNCYAFVAGNPFSTTEIGFGDDREVSGTAGKPMLSVLQHKKIGEIVVVVSRYFGGIKLGTGGLVRAYSSSVQLALENLPLIDCVSVKTVQIIYEYQYENSIRQILNKYHIEIKDSNYSENVEMKIEVPIDGLEELNIELQNSTSGKVLLDEI